MPWEGAGRGQDGSLEFAFCGSACAQTLQTERAMALLEKVWEKPLSLGLSGILKARGAILKAL